MKQIVTATELRLGNWIATEQDDLIRVDIDLLKSINAQQIKVFIVPVTRDLLIKSGFVPEKSNSFDCVYRFVSPKVSFLITERYGKFFQGIGCSISSLHELQNIFFALTKIEMPVFMYTKISHDALTALGFTITDGYYSMPVFEGDSFLFDPATGKYGFSDRQTGELFWANDGTVTDIEDLKMLRNSVLA